MDGKSSIPFYHHFLSGSQYRIANDKLLRVAAIYGANASGKSNVYNAFEYMTYYVLESFKFGDEDGRRRKKEEDYQKVIPFLFDENSRNQETTFEVFYVDNAEQTGKIYQYGFSLKDSEVVEEFWRSGRELFPFQNASTGICDKQGYTEECGGIFFIFR